MNKKEFLKENLINSMKACSVTLNCKEYTLDIVPKNNQELVKLNSNNKELYAFFHIPKTPAYYLKLSISKRVYEKKLKTIQIYLLKEYILYIIILAIIALVFSLYSLYPLKRAIELNDEFVKDMIHDINTPISSMKINLAILEKKFGLQDIICRLKQSLNSIESLQNNLQSFLSHSKLQVEEFNLKELILNRVEHFSKIYGVNIESKLNKIKVNTNKTAFCRIVSNIIDNACKHNVNKDLKVVLELKDEKLYITDNGKGIKDIDKIFTRGFTNSQRGLGLGLSIVKKLSKELNINIEVVSEVNKGTIFILDLSKVIVK